MPVPASTGVKMASHFLLFVVASLTFSSASINHYGHQVNQSPLSAFSKYLPKPYFEPLTLPSISSIPSSSGENDQPRTIITNDSILSVPLSFTYFCGPFDQVFESATVTSFNEPPHYGEFCGNHEEYRSTSVDNLLEAQNSSNIPEEIYFDRSLNLRVAV